MLTDGRRAVAVSTARVDGDFAVDGNPTDLQARRADIHPAPWTWLRQVHGHEVVDVDRPGAHQGAEADGAVVAVSDAPIAVQTADCVPVVLVGTSSVALIHAGWRGWMAGIAEVASNRLNHAVTEVWVGPHIDVGSYAFSPDDLAPIQERFGPSVVGRTDDGRPALDLDAVIDRAGSALGWPSSTPLGGQTHYTSSEDFFSHRVRQDAQRQTTVVWLEQP